MVPVHDYEKRYAEAFAITKMRTFKHEPFFIVGGGGRGGGGGGGLFVVLYTYIPPPVCMHSDMPIYGCIPKVHTNVLYDFIGP